MPHVLFTKSWIGSLLAEKLRMSHDAADAIPAADLRSRPMADLVAAIVSRATIVVPRLDRARITREGPEAVSSHSGGPVLVRLVFTVPFAGDGRCFDCKTTLPGPGLEIQAGHVDVLEGRLRVSYELPTRDPVVCKSTFEADLDAIEARLDELRAACEAHHLALPTAARGRVQERLRVLDDSDWDTLLGYPRTRP
jgi:hypothetical protein